MRHPFKSIVAAAATLTIVAAVAVFTAGAGASRAALDSAAAEHLRSLDGAPDSAGTLIYRGTVFAQRDPAAGPLYTYERRLAGDAQGLVASHLTRDPQGRLIIAEQAQFTPSYDLRRFDVANAQGGFAGSAELVDGGRRLAYRLVENGRISTASEDVTGPLVSGPSLHGFVLNHWEELSAGKGLAVRMIVMTKKTTYGFIVRRVAAREDGLATFSITPDSLLVQLIVAPLTVSFDPATRHLVRYEGRVPPQRELGGRLADLDARVDYTMIAASYR